MASPYTGTGLLGVITDPFSTGMRNVYNTGPAHPNSGTLYNLGDTITYLMRGVDSTGAYVYWTADFPDGTAAEYRGANLPIVKVCIFKTM